MTPDDVTQTLLARARALADGVVALAPQLLIALIALLLTWAISAGMRYTIRRVGTRLNLRRNLVDVLILIAKTGIWVAGVLIALTIVFPTITPARALTTLGLGSVAVGLAFKDTFENFLAGILILLREPFAIGDFVECEGIEGQIEEITIRDTRIRRTDGQLVVMPNHALFQNPVVVRTNRDVRRTTVICGVAYGEDVDAARAVIHDAVVAVDTVRDDVRDVQVFAHAFGSSSIDFEITWWTGSRPVDIRTSRDQVVAAVKRALDEAGIEIPFPYQTLTFKEPLPIRRMSSQDGDAAR